MALTGTLKFDEIPGESRIVNHEEEIDFFDLKMSLSRHLEEARGQGRVTGRVLLSPVTIRKKVDLATPDLMAACVRASHLATGVLSVRKDSGDDPLDYYVITLENVLISRVETMGIGVGERDGQIIYEEVDMISDTITIAYNAQDDSHAAGGGTEFFYDLRAAQ